LLAARPSCGATPTCHTARTTDDPDTCYKNAKWAQTIGIHTTKSAEYYGKYPVTDKSNVQDFQYILFRHGLWNCTLPCEASARLRDYAESLHHEHIPPNVAGGGWPIWSWVLLFCGLVLAVPVFACVPPSQVLAWARINSRHPSRRATDQNNPRAIMKAMSADAVPLSPPSPIIADPVATSALSVPVYTYRVGTASRVNATSQAIVQPISHTALAVPVAHVASRAQSPVRPMAQAFPSLLASTSQAMRATSSDGKF
jgi:hypothetical protein